MLTPWAVLVDIQIPPQLGIFFQQRLVPVTRWHVGTFIEGRVWTIGSVPMACYVTRGYVYIYIYSFHSQPESNAYDFLKLHVVWWNLRNWRWVAMFTSVFGLAIRRWQRFCDNSSRKCAGLNEHQTNNDKQITGRSRSNYSWNTGQKCI